MSESIMAKYTASPTCPTLPVHGVYGGVMASGHVMVSLFVDRPGEPAYVEVGPAGGSESPPVLPLREVLARLDMDVATAHAVGAWLTEITEKAGYTPGRSAGAALQ